jgi:hypothetical protein
MQWSMPLRVQQVVAGLLGLTAVTAFTLGVINAPDRGRLPGERADGASGALIQATEATPLSQERIEGPPEPTPLTPEQQAKLDADKAAKAEAAAEARLAAAGVHPTAPSTAPTQAAPAAPQQDRVGELLENTLPPPEEPPH